MEPATKNTKDMSTISASELQYMKQSSRLNQNKFFLTMFQYEATEEDEVSALSGDVLFLVDHDDPSSEWYVVANINAPLMPVGNFPKEFVRELDEDEWSEAFKEQKEHRHEVKRECEKKGGKLNYKPYLCAG